MITPCNTLACDNRSLIHIPWRFDDTQLLLISQLHHFQSHISSETQHSRDDRPVLSSVLWSHRNPQSACSVDNGIKRELQIELQASRELLTMASQVEGTFEVAGGKSLYTLSYLVSATWFILRPLSRDCGLRELFSSSPSFLSYFTSSPHPAVHSSKWWCNCYPGCCILDPAHNFCCPTAPTNTRIPNQPSPPPPLKPN